MWYRRIVLFSFAAYFCSLLWRVVDSASRASETLAWVLPLSVCVLVMVPENRFKAGEFLSVLKTWRSGNNEGSKL